MVNRMDINLYFQDKSLIFSGGPAFPEAFVLAAAELGESQRAKVLKIFETHNTVVVRTPAPEEAFARFAQEFTTVEAAGGLVRDTTGEAVLMIYRNERWDLPKGHVEVGEAVAEAALREVEEETGVQAHLGEKICETLHAYYFPRTARWELKRTHWFAMQAAADQTQVTPQTEEGIAQVAWVAPQELARCLAATYPTIRQVFAAAQG